MDWKLLQLTARERTGGRTLAWLGAVLFALGALGGPGHAGDPNQVWKTVETEHFIIHYYEPLDEVAQRVAAVAERSHQLLAPVFDHRPSEKTQIVLTDDTDGANGFASVLPRNSIRLFASAPGFLSQLGDHDDWLFGLTAHEYTHILHLDTISGLPKLYNRVFGKTWAPNQVQPRWVIEGIATYQESKRSSGGRTRNAIFQQELRAATLADARLDLDAVTNEPRAWPRGSAAYLYGSYFLKFVFDRYGEDKMRELSWAYGTTIIPYGLNRSIKNVTGETFNQLYADWLDYLRDTYSVEFEAIERAGLREGRRMTFTAEGNGRPRYSRDGSYIVWRQSDGYSEARLRAMPSGGDASAAYDYADIDRIGGYALLGDGSLIVEQARQFRTEYSFNDLIRWDRATGEIHRLTRGMRTRNPAVSPDEQQVAFVLNDRGQTRLAVMPLRTGAKPRILWAGGRYDQVDMPHWSPDSARVAFSAWSDGGYRDLMIAEVATGQVTRLSRDRANDANPVFSPDGRYLYYSSDRTGIYNIYARELSTGRLHQVTNVIGGALWPDISPDGKRLVYQGFGVGGYEIYELAIEPETWLEPLPYIDDRPDPVRIDEPAQAIAARPYRALETLAPQSYTLELVAASLGNTLNVSTGGSDAASLHSYSLLASIGLERRNINTAVSYTYRRFWPSLRLAAARTASLRSGLRIDGVNTNYINDTYSLTASTSLPVLRTPESSGTLSLDYSIDWLVNAEDQYDEPDPNDTLPDFPEVDVAIAGIGLRWSYSDVRAFTHTVGPQQGRSLSASLRFNHPSLGSDFHSLDLNYSLNTFRRLPWGETATLAMRVAGGIRTTDRRRSALYFLGGVPEQDVVDSVINSIRFGSTGYLRGYERRSVRGRKFQLANLEYRQLLWNIERGISTLPFFVRRLHLAGLVDVGEAWSDEFVLSDVKIGVGGALRLDMVFGYFVPGSLEIGYARGLTGDGINEYWTLLTGTL
ncbi:MAG: BamA/TamA family outer membrane protein [Myxococcota bacterium]